MCSGRLDAAGLCTACKALRIEPQLLLLARPPRSDANRIHRHRHMPQMPNQMLPAERCLKKQASSAKGCQDLAAAKIEGRKRLIAQVASSPMPRIAAWFGP